MIIEQFIQSPFQQNTRVVACENTRTAICIDPGEDSPELESFIRDNGLILQAITLTHAHLDHIGGVTPLAAAFPEAEIILHADDKEMYFNLPLQPLRMGIPREQLAAFGMDYETPPKLTRHWEDNEIYRVGELEFTIMHCPGHSPGHVVFAEMEKKVLFGGDCLFLGSIGRTDLPGGDHEQLINSINEKILPLGDDFTVYTGHGPETTIGHERLTNPFLTGIYNFE